MIANNCARIMDDNDSSGTEDVSDSDNPFLIDRKIVSDALSAPPSREFLLNHETSSTTTTVIRDPNGLPDFCCLDTDTQDRLQALLQAAGISKTADDSRAFRDPELLKRLTTSVSSALDEAAAALTRLKSDDKNLEDPAASVFAEISSNGLAEDGESMLSLACSAGYYELAQVLLAMRTNVDDRGSKNDCTPLMEAASAGHADIVKLLIAHGADMNAQSTTGNTALVYACAGGHEEVVRVLLKAGADVTLHNQNGHTPLMEASTAGHVNITKLLVEHGAYNQEFKVGLDSPLTLASYKGHIEMVKYLLKAGAEINNPGRQEELHTALMEASIDGHVEVARLLFDAGAQVNLPTDSFESPLTLAACGGHVELAQLLLERGANLEEPNDDGYTPLMEAARDGHDEMVALLLEWGAQVNAQTEETGETALTLACCGGHVEVAQLLLNHGADIELGANTPLMEAAQEGRTGTVSLLLSHGANPRARTAAGDTPLTYAAENGHDHVCSLLLDAGAGSDSGAHALLRASRSGHTSVVHLLLLRNAACANASTADGEQSALSQACSGGHLGVVELLLRSGADPNKKLKDGSTCIMEAAKGGHTNVVHLLLDWPNVTSVPTVPSGHPVLGAVSERPPTPAPLPVQLPSCTDGAFRPVQPALGNTNLIAQSRTNLPLDASSMQQHPFGTSNTLVSPVANVLPQFGLPSTSTTLLNTTAIAAPKATMATMMSYNNGGGTATGGATGAGLMLPVVPHPLLPRPTPGVCGGGSRSAPASLISGSDGTSDHLRDRYRLSHTDETKFWDMTTRVMAKFVKEKQKEALLKMQERSSKQQQKPPKVSSSNVATQATPCQSKLQPVTNPLAQPAPQPQVIPTAMATSLASQYHQQSVPPLSQLPSLSPMTTPNEEDQRLLNWLDKFDKVVGKVHKLATTVFRDESLAAAACRKLIPTLLPACSDAARLAPDQADGAKPIIGQNNELDTDALVEYCKSNWLKLVNEADIEEAFQLPTLPQNAAVPFLETYEDAQPEHQQSLPSLLDDATTDTTSAASLFYNNNAPSELDAALGWHNLTPEQQQQFVSFQLLSTLDPVQLNYLQQPANAAALVRQLQQNPQLDLVTASRYLIGPAMDEIVNATASQQICGGMGGVESGVPMTPEQINTVMEALVSMHKSMATVTNNTISAGEGVGLLPDNLADSATTGFLNLPVPMPMKQGAADQALPPLDPSAMKFSPKVTAWLDTLKPVQTATPVPTPVATVNDLSATTAPPAIRRNTVKATQTQTDATTTTGSGVSTRQKTSSNATTTCAMAGAGAAVDLNTQTDSNHDTALTLACAGGHADLVQLLLNRGANLEHQDKKGFTPLILAATAGHASVVELLYQYGANPEAQSERTKDTALSLACSSGKKDVVEFLLKKNVNKEHRNVSDYTPLSLAASGGYTDIISLLLQYGAEINSRTGSKLGISPLMLASMNGHVQAVKLLLEKSADINAQIETNRNTALTLACFQGRHEVVKFLLQYGANVEHRAKTGLTPLMEAASGGYVEVGRILLDYGADPNSAPVPSSRDTALTIAADKGHAKFVELLLQNGSQLDCKTKKGCTALWLASNGGFADVVQALVKSGACPDGQDNRKVSPLMAAFRKSHLKVVRYLVRHVQQFPADTECNRFLTSLADKEVAAKCKLCMDLIMTAKERQAHEANKAAAVLLQELEHEQQLLETRRQAKQRQKEKRKAKRKAKKGVAPSGAGKEANDDDSGDDLDEEEEAKVVQPKKKVLAMPVETTASSRSSSSRSVSRSASPELMVAPVEANLKARERIENLVTLSQLAAPTALDETEEVLKRVPAVPGCRAALATSTKSSPENALLSAAAQQDNRRRRRLRRTRPISGTSVERQQLQVVATKPVGIVHPQQQQQRVILNGELARAKITTNEAHRPEPQHDDGWSKTTSSSTSSSAARIVSVTSQQQPQPSAFAPIQKSSSGGTTSRITTTINNSSIGLAGGRSSISIASNARPALLGSAPIVTGTQQKTSQADDSINILRDTKKQPQRIYVSSHSIARVIGRGGSNINAIREASGAHIEVEKQQKGQTDRLITIRGTVETTRHAILMINGLINDPDIPVLDIIGKVKSKEATVTKSQEFYSGAGRTALKEGFATSFNETKPKTVATASTLFPEMTVWQSSNAQKQKMTKVGASGGAGKTQANVSKANNNQTITATLKPKPDATGTSTLEYSPFSTPNVWLSRAAAAAAALGSCATTTSIAGASKMNFASVAAANLAQLNVQATNSLRQNSPPQQDANFDGKGGKSSDELKKAPGYRASKFLEQNENVKNIDSEIQNGKNCQNLEPASNILLASPHFQPQNEHANNFGSVPTKTDSSHQNLETKPFAKNSILQNYNQQADMMQRNFGVHESVMFTTEKNTLQPKAATFGDEDEAAVDSVAKCLTNYLMEHHSPVVSEKTPGQSSSLANNNANAEGRRSAGVAAAYFSPISLPRPASAMEAEKPKPNVSGATINLAQHYNNSNPIDNNSSLNCLANLLLPTPIGGERRSKTNLNLIGNFPTGFFAAQALEQNCVGGCNNVTTTTSNNIVQRPIFPNSRPQEAWECTDPDWLSNFSGLSANLAQLQAMQNQPQQQLVDMMQQPPPFESPYPSKINAGLEATTTLAPPTLYNQQQAPPPIAKQPPMENGMAPFDPDLFLWMNQASAPSFNKSAPPHAPPTHQPPPPMRNYYQPPPPPHFVDQSSSSAFGQSKIAPLMFNKAPPTLMNGAPMQNDPWAASAYNAAPPMWMNGVGGGGDSMLNQYATAPPTNFFAGSGGQSSQPRHQAPSFFPTATNQQQAMPPMFPQTRGVIGQPQAHAQQQPAHQQQNWRAW